MMKFFFALALSLEWILFQRTQKNTHETHTQEIQKFGRFLLSGLATN